MLGNPKDKVESEQWFGIYKIMCGESHQNYVGQTRMRVRNRFKEHVKYYRYGRLDSCVANHINDTRHKIQLENL